MTEFRRGYDAKLVCWEGIPSAQGLGGLDN